MLFLESVAAKLQSRAAGETTVRPERRSEAAESSGR
jgi:hypothetical protein